MKDLLKKLENGTASLDEIKQIEALIEDNQLDPAEIDGFRELVKMNAEIEVPEPSEAMTVNFQRELSDFKEKKSTGFHWNWDAFFQVPALRIAYSIVLVVVGIGVAGLFKGEDEKIGALTEEVSSIKEMMMLSLLDQESISDRLKAVNLASDLPEASSRVTDALIQTLNQDENVNVRLAALEALYPYSDVPQVRTALVASIKHQEAPLMQIALAEMMAALQEKQSLEQLNAIIEQENTPEDVKEQIRKSIDVLI